MELSNGARDGIGARPQEQSLIRQERDVAPQPGEFRRAEWQHAPGWAMQHPRGVADVPAILHVAKAVDPGGSIKNTSAAQNAI